MANEQLLLSPLFSNSTTKFEMEVTLHSLLLPSHSPIGLLFLPSPIWSYLIAIYHCILSHGAILVEIIPFLFIKSRLRRMVSAILFSSINVSPFVLGCYRIKLVLILGWRSGASSSPFWRIFSSQAMFRPKVLIVCFPSSSCWASPGLAPWMTFQ